MVSILCWSSRNSRVCAASPHSKGPGESPIAGIIADLARFLSARRPPGALWVPLNPFRFSTYERAKYRENLEAALSLASNHGFFQVLWNDDHDERFRYRGWAAESPKRYLDPLASCPNYRMPAGLPITLQLGSGYRGNMTSFSLIGPGGAVETCGFDWTSYQNADPATRGWARKSMKFFGGIILVPRKPLADGRYTVAVATQRENYSWSFTVANQPSPSAKAQGRK